MSETAVKDWSPKMKALKESLSWGDQRRLAGRLGCHQNTVYRALKGKVSNEDFLAKLEAEAQIILFVRERYSL